MEIVIREYIEHKPNGDRATKRTRVSRFVVFLHSGEKFAKLATFDQYDDYQTAITTAREVQLSRARSYAAALLDVLPGNTTMREVRMVEREVRKVEWVEEGFAEENE